MMLQPDANCDEKKFTWALFLTVGRIPTVLITTFRITTSRFSQFRTSWFDRRMKKLTRLVDLFKLLAVKIIRVLVEDMDMVVVPMVAAALVVVDSNGIKETNTGDLRLIRRGLRFTRIILRLAITILILLLPAIKTFRIATTSNVEGVDALPSKEERLFKDAVQDVAILDAAPMEDVETMDKGIRTSLRISLIILKT